MRRLIDYVSSKTNSLKDLSVFLGLTDSLWDDCFHAPVGVVEVVEIEERREARKVVSNCQLSLW